jgi:hypothetical protein
MSLVAGERVVYCFSGIPLPTNMDDRTDGYDTMLQSVREWKLWIDSARATGKRVNFFLHQMDRLLQKETRHPPDARFWTELYSDLSALCHEVGIEE